MTNMYVIQVIPLRRGIELDALSYFSGVEYPLGALLQVPVRNSMMMGLVTNVSEVSTAKTALRAATFSLRKLPAQGDVQRLSPAYIRTAAALGAQYGAHQGSILYSLLPPEIQSGDITLPHTHYIDPEETHTPEILQAHKAERYASYRLLVRETFAHSGSVLIVVPTGVEAEDVQNALASGIDDRVIILTSTMPKKALKASYEALQDFSRSKLIIATSSHAMIERHDITLTIMEHARSPHYKDRIRPYLDYRDVLRMHSEYTGRRFLMGDILPRTEEEWARREDRYHTFGETPKRLQLEGKLEVVRMKDITIPNPTFALFSEPVIELLKESKKKKTHIFIFAARRGLAPVVACMDCGFIFRSPHSGAPYSLIRTTKHGAEERWFVCSTSGERVRASDTCEACGSWKLRERGIGIQFVHDELRKLLPSTPVVLFDHTSASTFKKACFLRDAFYDKKGGVMLGTSMAVPYLTAPIDTSIVVNMDALLATPTWRLEEENLALLLKLREITKGSVHVQMRSGTEPELLGYAKHATVEQFYTDELELRKSFNYPPYTTFIHLTWQGPLAIVKKLEEDVLRILGPFSISTYPSPTSPKDSLIMYGLLRTPASTWPHKDIIGALRQLPPSIRVVINPDRIV